METRTFTVPIDALARVCIAAFDGDENKLRRELAYLGVPVDHIIDKLRELSPR